jgi:hypothetical protein
MTASYYGGNPEDIPKPWKKKFPGKEKRLVEIAVVIFSVGVHYHTSISEEDNPVWDSSGDCGGGWRTFWHHPKNLRGRFFEQSCATPYHAKKFIDETLRKFPKKTHKVVWKYGEEYIKTEYIQREGD